MRFDYARMMFWRITLKIARRISFDALAQLLMFCMRERLPNGKDKFLVWRRKDDRIILLALAPEGIDKVLTALAQDRKFQVLHLSRNWIRRLMDLHLPRGVPELSCMNPGAETELKTLKRNYLKFLKEFVLVLHPKAGIDCVISNSMISHPAWDWGAAAHKKKFPYIVFHVEKTIKEFSMLSGSGASAQSLSDSLAQYGIHLRTRVIVMTEEIRQAFINSGVVPEMQISSVEAGQHDTNFASDSDITKTVCSAFMKSAEAELFNKK
jgi:hypothetical protein